MVSLNQIKRIFRKISSRNRLFAFVYQYAAELKMEVFKSLTDEEYIRQRYKECMGRELDLDNPLKFTEKLQWLKLNDRNPRYTELADKYLVKNVIGNKIGYDHVIPIVGGPWSSVDEICFDKLPERFVLKCNHDCGSTIVCTDKSIFDYKKAKKFLDRRLRENYYLMSREWPYKNIKPLIFAEKYMVNSESNDLKDYKFLCFDGEPRIMFIASDRTNVTTETKFDFFDMDFSPLHIVNGHPNSVILPQKPNSFNEMKKLARIISEGIPHVRVDFYEVDGRVYFGEMTFYHYGGIVPFEPETWDDTLGTYISLPTIECYSE